MSDALGVPHGDVRGIGGGDGALDTTVAAGARTGLDLHRGSHRPAEVPGGAQRALQARAADLEGVIACDRVVLIESTRDAPRQLADGVDVRTAWAVDEHLEHAACQLDVVDLQTGRIHEGDHDLPHALDSAHGSTSS